MDNIFPTFKLSNGEVGGFTTLQRRLQRWWHQLPTGVRSPIWPGLLAALIILGMLLAFHQVVVGAVQQGELRHKVSAMQAEAAWRCNSLRGLDAIGSCLLELNSTAHGDPLLQVQDRPRVRPSSAQYALENNLD
jgi:hypothetical protein